MLIVNGVSSFASFPFAQVRSEKKNTNMIKPIEDASGGIYSAVSRGTLFHVPGKRAFKLSSQGSKAGPKSKVNSMVRRASAEANVLQHLAQGLGPAPRPALGLQRDLLVVRVADAQGHVVAC